MVVFEFGKLFLTPHLWYLLVSHVSLTGSPEMGRTSLKVPILLRATSTGPEREGGFSESRRIR